MKIYQIHKYGGDWEDYRDYVVGIYISYEKANIEMERLEKEEQQLRMCDSCPLMYCPEDCAGHDCDDCIDYRVKKAKEYCDRYKPPFDENRDYCVNRYFSFVDNHFRIEEVEVIE